MRLHVAIPLRWSDFDAYAHVNNAEMLRLLEEARIQAFWKPDSPQPGGMATAVLDARPGAESISLIARQEIEYLAPVPYQRRPLDVQMWFGKVGGSSIDVCYEVYNDPANDERVLYARATSTLVLVDAATGRPVRIAPDMRAAWMPYLGAPNEFSHR